MMRFVKALVMTAGLACSAPAADFSGTFTPSQEKRVREIAREELKSLLEAQPRLSQPAAAQAPKAAGPALSGRDYAEFVQTVLGGAQGTLYVGGVPARGNRFYTIPFHADTLPGVLPGAYDCYALGGVAVMDRLPDPVITSAPAFATPVRSAAYQLFAPARRTCTGPNCPQ